MMNEERYLTGESSCFPKAFEMLEQIFEEQVFELLAVPAEEGSGEARIPYMMNDAIECTLVLENCKARGDMETLLAEIPDGTLHGRLERKDGGYGLILRTESGTAAALWFGNIRIERKLYRYHEIGHFWARGQEQWRRIVYIAGTLHDKYQYFGPEVCSAEEMELAKLSGFGPLARWSPLGDAPGRLDSMDPDSVAVMRKLSEEAGDRGYLRLLNLYGRFPVRALSRVLSDALAEPGRIRLYLLLEEKIRKASLAYEKRDYGKEQNRMIREKREETGRILREIGMDGTWPDYRKGQCAVTVMEEHPFCAGDREDVTFRIRFMVSVFPDTYEGRNGGFFRGRGRSGRIADSIGELLDMLREYRGQGMETGARRKIKITEK